MFECGICNKIFQDNQIGEYQQHVFYCHKTTLKPEQKMRFTVDPLNQKYPGDTIFNPPKQETSPLQHQQGGDHYKKMKIQPVVFIHENGLNFCQGNVIKYVCRYKDKNGIEDLKKAKHYIDLLIDLEGKSLEQ